ncbi:superinfection immunity protein [uncultured Microbulbifer sp.]|uniref:superinfection immunity protein n=1 Tax=uncultured Microbulbifer sp. TaxID=348147 RepID=UPI00260294E3|nr:superinfection immunity protein [uncultured Microbulbifer sp.]
MLEVFSGISLAKGVIFIVLFLLVWFLPSVVAFFFNRRNFGKICLANIPALLSWVAWFALLAWAVSGKVGKNPGSGAIGSRSRAADAPAVEKRG